MRVIEQKMIAAIVNATNMRSGNTVVEADADGKAWRVLLHNNVIATGTDLTFTFTLAGWNTPTTRSRVNALLRRLAVGDNAVYQHSFTAYFKANNKGAREIGNREWIEVSRVASTI